MGNINARDRPYPGDELDSSMEDNIKHESGAAKVALDGILANVKRVHVEGLVRTKEDVVS